MKKINICFAIMFSAMTMVGCQKDFDGILTATIEDYHRNGGKVYIEEGATFSDPNYACWHDGDLVQVNGGNHDIQINNEGGVAKAIINIDNQYMENHHTFSAAYPAELVTWYDAGGNWYKLDLPQEQVYREKLNPNGEMVQVVQAPMMGYTTGNELRFYNTGALVKVNIKNSSNGLIRVRSIQLTAITENEKLWGRAKYEQALGGVPVLNGIEGGGNSVVLAIPYDNSGVDVGKIKTFYIAIPNVDSKFKVEVVYGIGTTLESMRLYTRESQVKNMIGRNSIAVMGFEMKGDDPMHNFGDGSMENPFQVKTPFDLMVVSGRCKIAGTEGDYYVQMNDITIPDMGVGIEGEHFEGIGSGATPFKGHYDGGGYKIMNETSHSVFGCVASGTIKNLTVASTLVGSGDLGGIVKEIHSTGVVLIDSCRFEGSLSGTNGVGGICGKVTAPQADVTIQKCINRGLITGGMVGGIVGSLASGNGVVKIDKCVNYDTAVVTCNSMDGAGGGIVGQSLHNNIKLHNVINHGKIVSTVTVDAGGLLGKMSGGDIFNSYSDGVIATLGTVGGIVGVMSGAVTMNNMYVLGAVPKNGDGTLRSGTYWFVGSGGNNATGNYLYSSAANSDTGIPKITVNKLDALNYDFSVSMNAHRGAGEKWGYVGDKIGLLFENFVWYR